MFRSTIKDECMKFKNTNGQILLFLAIFGLVVNLSGCTSGDEKSDVDAVQDVESGESVEGASAAGDDSLLSDALPEEALGSDSTASKPSTDESLTPANEPPLDISDSPDAVSSEPPMTIDDSSTVTDSAPPAPAPVDEPSAMDEGTSMVSSTEEATTEEEAPKPKPVIPLQKMATKPWKVGKTWFNALYFARPGDTLSTISQNIYGEDRTDLLKKGNTTYQRRDTRPGDKVYYNSPKRPDDGEQMLTWFEENSVQPEVYITKEGDNIRTLSKDLLGYDGAWKEVWASNLNVESKGELTAGTEIRYWKAAAVAAAPTSAPDDSAAAGNMENAQPPPVDMSSGNTAMNEEMPPPPPMDQPAEMSPPPAPDQAMGDMPPPPAYPDQAMNDIPPPPPMETAPPPPPPMEPMKEKTSDLEATAMDEDTMMALGTVAIAAAGIAALLVMRRRRKQKDMESQFSDQTQVGS
jgi:hypothetical protein